MANPATLSTLIRRLPPFQRAWKQIALELKQAQCPVAFEICCGQSPKAGLALHELFLSQQIGFIDASVSALATCKKIMCRLAPECDALFINSSLEEFYYDEPVQLLVGNHVFDDLLIQHYLDYVGQIDRKAYQRKEEYLTLVAELLLFYRSNHSLFLNHLAKHFSRIIDRNGRIILSDYLSYYEKRFQLRDWALLRFELVDKLSQHLINEGFQPVILQQIPALFNRVDIWEKRC